VSPRRAPLVGLINVKSARSRAAGPVPAGGIVKIPGDVRPNGNSTEFDRAAPFTTCTVAVDPVAPNGTSALICPVLTKYNGAAIPFTSTCTPFKVVGNGRLNATVVADESPPPKIVKKEPGDNGAPTGAKLPAFNTPCGLTKTPIPVAAAALTPSCNS